MRVAVYDRIAPGAALHGTSPRNSRGRMMSAGVRPLLASSVVVVVVGVSVHAAEKGARNARSSAEILGGRDSTGGL